ESLPGGFALGTLSYMAPEQARGEPADARSDVFAFGVVVFQMLTCALPFEATRYLSLMHNLHFGTPKDLLALRPDTPPQLAALVTKCLDKEPAARYQEMNEVARELRAISSALFSG